MSSNCRILSVKAGGYPPLFSFWQLPLECFFLEFENSTKENFWNFRKDPTQDIFSSTFNSQDAWDSLHLDKMNYLDISGLSLAHNKVIFHHFISSSMCFMKIFFLNISFDSCSVHQYWREATLSAATSSIQVVLNNHNWSFSFWDWLLSPWILFVCFGKNIWFSKYYNILRWPLIF